MVHQKWSVRTLQATAFIDTATSFIYLFLSIHSLIYSLVSFIYLFIYDLPTTLSVAKNFTTLNDTVSVQSISIIVQNFRPTQRFLYCKTATWFRPNKESSSACQIKTTLNKVYTHTKYSLVSFLWDSINYEKLSWSRKYRANIFYVYLFIHSHSYTECSAQELVNKRWYEKLVKIRLIC